MPITVTAPRGILTAEGERQILPRLSAELIDVSGFAGNSFFEAIVGGTVQLLDPDDVYASGHPQPIVMVELKLPAVGLPTLESRAAFIERATAVVDDELTIDGHAPNSTWVNILNAADGAWGIGGRSWTNDALVTAIEQGSCRQSDVRSLVPTARPPRRMSVLAGVSGAGVTQPLRGRRAPPHRAARRRRLPCAGQPAGAHQRDRRHRSPPPPGSRRP